MQLHCMRLADKRSVAWEQGAPEDEVQLITPELHRASKHDDSVLREAVTEKYWVGISKFQGFHAQQARIKDGNGSMLPAGQRAQTMAVYFQNVHWA